MTKLYFYVYYSILILISASTAQENMRIVGGHEAPKDFGLFHASLQNLSGYHVCGGAIVSKWHIVTAAHCVKSAEAKFIRAIVGTTHLNNGGIIHDIASINVYSKFNFSTNANDIALLMVKRKFDLNRVQVLSLREENLVEGDIILISGFGAKSVNGESSNKLYLLMLSVFNQDTCRYAMRYTRNVTDEMFCTFTKIGQGTCKGDSGSPVIKDGNLVGVVSWGIPCAVGFPDVHTRVAPFVKWIRSQIRNDIC